MRQHHSPTPASGQLAAEYLDEKQAAELLGVKPRTVRSLRAERGLPCLKITNKILRFRRADIEDWILKYRVAFPPKSRARSVAPATPPPRPSCKTGARQGSAQ